MSETQPERQLRELLEGVASEVPGTKVEIHGLYDDTNAERLDTILALIAERGVAHALNRNGFVVVPIDGGTRDVTVAPIELQGEPYIDLGVFLGIRPPGDESAQQKLGELMVELNSDAGPKGVIQPDSGALRLHSQLPEVGLSADALFTGIAVLGRFARQLAKRIDELGGGRTLQSSWEQKGFSAEKVFKT